MRQTLRVELEQPIDGLQSREREASISGSAQRRLASATSLLYGAGNAHVTVLQIGSSVFNRRRVDLVFFFFFFVVFSLALFTLEHCNGDNEQSSKAQTHFWNSASCSAMHSRVRIPPPALFGDLHREIGFAVSANPNRLLREVSSREETAYAFGEVFVLGKQNRLPWEKLRDLCRLGSPGI